MKTQRQHFLGMVILTILLLSSFISVSAEQFIDNITLKQGERKALILSSAYQSIMTSYGIGSSSWWSDNTNVCSVSSRTKVSCDIFGSSVGLTYVHFKGEYWSGNVISEYTCYWTIEVVPKDEPGPNGDDNTLTDEDYSLPEESWGDYGNYDFSWYNKNQTEFTISTNKELAGMAYLVKNEYADFEGKTIRLANDIDISGKKWITFSTFKGTLDGQGYYISGFASESGFIGRIEGGTLKNLNLQGYIYVNEPQYERNTSFTITIGALACGAYNCVIERCNSNVNIIYRRTKALGNGNYPEDVHIGGLVGSAGDGFTSMYIRYCTFDGSIKCRIYDEPIHVGGISGNSNKLAHIEYCENNASIISVESERTLYNSSFHPILLSGINGDTTSPLNMPEIICCRNICAFSFKHTASINSYYNYFWIEGIGKGKAVNCYSVIPSITLSASEPCELRYYGIGEEQVKANYSNSDVDIQTTLNVNQSNSGSTAFSSAQMRTPGFLQELNMYPMLEMDGPVWTQDEGGYPYIAKLHEVSKKGDVNGDGSVDVADIASVISVMAEGVGADPESARTADVNSDGTVDVADIASVIDIMAARARMQTVEEE